MSEIDREPFARIPAMPSLMISLWISNTLVGLVFYFLVHARFF